MGLGEQENPRAPGQASGSMWGVGVFERRQLESAARKDALSAVAIELESRANHISEAITWVKADNPRVADYLGAVRHGLSLGALAARAKL